MVKSSWAKWFSNSQTKLFFRKLAEEKDRALESQNNLTTCGDELVKNFYEHKGLVKGLMSAYSIAKFLVKEEGQ